MSRRALLIAGILVLVAAPAALAGSATITVRDRDRGRPACADIDKVVADSGRKTTTFTITMAADAKAKPCGGKTAPEILLDVPWGGQCSTTAHAMACEGGAGGPLSTSIQHGVWVISIATKELPHTPPGHPRRGTFSALLYRNGDGDQTPQASLKIG